MNDLITTREKHYVKLTYIFLFYLLFFVPGVFLVGKTAGKNFIKSKTGWYLAINASGHVYMTVSHVDKNCFKGECPADISCFHD